MGKNIIVNGIEYSSINEALIRYNISYSTYYRRRKVLNMTLEETFKTPKCTEIDIPGIGKFNSINQCCRELGISKYKLLKVISQEKQLNTIINEESQHKVTDHNGIEFESIREMCRYYNIKEYIYRNRIKAKWNKKDALTVKIQDYGRKISMFGKDYASIIELGNEYKLNYNILTHRLRVGWGIHEVVVDKVLKHKFLYIGIDNKAYYSVDWILNPVCSRDIISKYRPDLLSLYDKENPTGEYNPYKKCIK